MKTAKKLIMENGFLVINYKITQKIGINASMLLSLLIDTQDYFENKPFYKTQKHIEEQIGMSKHIFLQSKKLLIEEGLITSWLHDNSTPYYFITDECYKKIQDIINYNGVSKNQTGGVGILDRGCMNIEQGVFKNQTGGVEILNTNNNKKQEQKSKNKKKEEISNNKLEITNQNIEDDFDFDIWVKTRKVEVEEKPKVIKTKCVSVFDNLDF